MTIKQALILKKKLYKKMEVETEKYTDIII